MKEINNVRIERDAERFLKAYRPQVEMLESKSLISKVRSVTPYDIYSLGKQLESFEVYKQLCEEDGTLSQLGKIPDVAFDVITVAYGTSPISVISSVQPIDEEKGTVYFKNVIAGDTRGNVTAGQSFAAASRAEDVSPLGYASDTATVHIGDTAAGTKTYNFTFGNAPLRTYKVRVEVNGLTATDDGNGRLVGYGIQGQVDYRTGAAVIQFYEDPNGVYPIMATAAQDFEASQDIPRLTMKLTTKSVDAQVFALKDTIGLEQSYALRRRFGMVAEDEVATDLISAINSEIVGSTIVKLRAGAMGNTQWSNTPPTGVSYLEHKQTFKDAIATAESVILGNAGRGTINVLIAGRNASSIISTLPGFTKISDGTTIGPHIFGTLDGVTVIRIPSVALLPANEVICLYNSGSPFEAAAIYAPYMPLVVTTALPSGNNPLVNQKAAAVWAAVDLLVSNFVTRITITD